jgi:hypothetical protein
MLSTILLLVIISEGRVKRINRRIRFERDGVDGPVLVLPHFIAV